MSLTVTILSDKESWINLYNKRLSNILTGWGHKVSIIHDVNNILTGDILFLLSFSQILKEDALRLNKNNIVVHASDLPDGRGMSPMTWQILEGKNEIPICLLEAVKDLDKGDIYIKDFITLTGYELSNEWQVLLGNKTVELCTNFISTYPGILDLSSKQEQKDITTFYKRRFPKDSELDITKSIKDAFNLFRVVDNEKYPAHFYLDENKYILKIYKSEN